MIPRIKELKTQENYKLYVKFDDNKSVIYDVYSDIEEINSFKQFLTNPYLFNQVQLDESRTCIYWNDEIDLASDTIYEYGKEI